MPKILNQYNKYAIRNLAQKKDDLYLCKIEIKRLQSISLVNLSDYDKHKIQYELKKEVMRKETLLNKLKTLGYTENRGRPKKTTTEKYCNSHKKFTAMLLSENLEYLKSLKSNREIDNISSFLDRLIESYKTSNNID